MLWIGIGVLIVLLFIYMMGGGGGDSSWVGGDYSDGVWDTFGDD